MQKQTVKILILVITTLIAVSLLFNSGLKKSKSPLVNGNSNKEKGVEEVAESSPSQNSIFGADMPKGSITGDICYPSESIPPLNLHFINTETRDDVVISSELNQSKYTLENVPLGEYIAFAYVRGMQENGGAYTEAVSCGLKVECTDHTIIRFLVEEKATTTGIDICDWYGAEIPDISL